MKINLISEWGNVVSNVRNNIVFENRNQAYGAYFIRREYPRTMFFSFFITATIIGFGALGLSLSNHFREGFVPPFELPDTQVIIDIVPASDVIPEDAKIKPENPVEPPKGKNDFPIVISDDTDNIDNNQTTQDDEIKPGKEDGKETNDDVIIIPENPGKGKDVVIVDTTEKVLDFVDVNPSFPGGEGKMYEFIKNKMKYPDIEKEIGISGTVHISFVVDKSGKIKDVTIGKGVSGGTNLAKEAQRVIGIMPDWNPGIYKGQTVSVRYRMPFRFVLQ